MPELAPNPSCVQARLEHEHELGLELAEGQRWGATAATGAFTWLSAVMLHLCGPLPPFSQLTLLAVLLSIARTVGVL